MFLNKWLSHFVALGEPQPVLVNSIPKSGTNLLKNIVLSISGTDSGIDLSLANETKNGAECLAYLRNKVQKFSPDQVYIGHIPYSSEVSTWLHDNQVKQLFIYRDPRDVTVSLYHYIMKEKTPSHAYYSMYSNFVSNEERLLKTITGFGEGKNIFKVSSDSIPSIGLVYQAYFPWVKESKNNFLSLRFEDLVGTEDECFKQLEKIAKFINPDMSINEEILQKIRSEGMDPKRSHTYRKGIINGWQDEYKHEHISAFRKNFDDRLFNQLGYDWNGAVSI